MDVKSELEELAEFNKKWALYEKQKIYHEVINKNNLYFVLFSVANFQVLIAVNVGPRKGLKEKIVVVDPTQQYDVDKIRIAAIFADNLYSRNTMGLLNLSIMKKQVLREDADIGMICRQHLEKQIILASRKPKDYALLLNRIRLSKHESIQAALPGSPGTKR